MYVKFYKTLSSCEVFGYNINEITFFVGGLMRLLILSLLLAVVLFNPVPSCRAEEVQPCVEMLCLNVGKADC